jgi:hypothetical protein
MKLYLTNGTMALLEPTFDGWLQHFGPNDDEDVVGGAVYIRHDNWPSVVGEGLCVGEGKMGTTKPDSPPLKLYPLQQCSAYIYYYHRDGQFLGAIGFHAPSGSLGFKDGSGRRFGGPISEAKRAGFMSVQPADVGVFVASGLSALVATNGYRAAAEKEYGELIDLCEKDGVPSRRVIVYAARCSSFGVTPDGRIGQPKGPQRVQAVNEVEARAQKKCCYLTTAACLAAGLPDDCRELTLLRWFRDHILMVDSNGRRDVQAYYATAPAVVAAVDARPDRLAIYSRVFTTGVAPAASAVARGEYTEAYRIYRALHAALCREFLPS